MAKIIKYKGERYVRVDGELEAKEYEVDFKDFLNRSDRTIKEHKDKIQKMQKHIKLIEQFKKDLEGVRKNGKSWEDVKVVIGTYKNKANSIGINALDMV